MTNRCNNMQWVYFSASPLYKFRAVHTPIIRSTGLTVSTVIGTIIGQAQIVSGTIWAWPIIVPMTVDTVRPVLLMMGVCTAWNM